MWLGGPLALAVLLVVATGPIATASDSPPMLLAGAMSPSPSRELLKNLAIFLVLSLFNGFFWYFGLFPRLLRKEKPSWPLDAWRGVSYGAWLTLCASALVFRGYFEYYVFTPLFGSVIGNSIWISWLLEVVVLLLISLVGLLAIRNFRRVESDLKRPT